MSSRYLTRLDALSANGFSGVTVTVRAVSSG